MLLSDSQTAQFRGISQRKLPSPNSLRIQDLPHFEVVPDLNDCFGGYASTSTFAETGSGYASAGSIALASGEYSLTKTRTVAVVHQTPRVTISRAAATAVAISSTPDGIHRSFSHSRSVSVYVS
jgi:hypothetical protein